MLNPEEKMEICYSWSLGHNTNNMAEALALWKGLNQFKSMLECLGIYIDKMVQKGDFFGLRPSSKDQIYSHEKFVDDYVGS